MQIMTTALNFTWYSQLSQRGTKWAEELVQFTAATAGLLAISLSLQMTAIYRSVMFTAILFDEYTRISLNHVRLSSAREDMPIEQSCQCPDL